MYNILRAKLSLCCHISNIPYIYSKSYVSKQHVHKACAYGGIEVQLHSFFISEINLGDFNNLVPALGESARGNHCILRLVGSQNLF